jgi:aerobic carbon-monoxide dehydrogenase large subunit
MNDQSLTSEQRAERLQGMGCRRKRVEDIRFVQGKGKLRRRPEAAWHALR